MGPFSFPPARTAESWAPGLAPLNPLATALGFLSLLRVEVLIEVRDRCRLDPLTRAVLVATSTAEPATLTGVNRLLHLGEDRTAAALESAVRAGLVERTADARYTLTGPGREALTAGRTVCRRERVRVTFRDGHFAPVPDPGPLTAQHPGPPPTTSRGHALAAELFARGDDWKQAIGFPFPAARVVTDPGDWRAVPVESADRFSAVLAATATDRVVGFVCEPPDWSLGPSFEIAGVAARGAFPEVFGDPPVADLVSAWQGWARARAVPPDDFAACTAAWSDHRLAITVPPRLHDWLRSHRGDVFAGRTWLWVGDGPVRRPSILEVRAAG